MSDTPLSGIAATRCASCKFLTSEGVGTCPRCGTSMERGELKITRRLEAPERRVTSQARQTDGIVACRLGCGHAAYLHDIPEDEEVVSTGCAECAREVSR